MVFATLVDQKLGPQIGGIDVAVSISETHTVSNQVTEHPVETGATVADHVRQLPDGLTLTGVFTNTPGRIADAVALAVSGDTADSKYEQLRALAKAGDVISVFTTLRFYGDMVITNLSVPRNRNSGSNLEFTITLQQIRFTTALEAVPLITRDADKSKITKKTKVGTKAKTPAPDRTAEQSRSVWGRLTLGRSGATSTAGLVAGN